MRGDDATLNACLCRARTACSFVLVVDGASMVCHPPFDVRSCGQGSGRSVGWREGVRVGQQRERERETQEVRGRQGTWIREGRGSRREWKLLAW